ncbi:MAG: hypothetical protein JW862_14245 [Anaerolineales bacterium]|nr:hypothetical protein [Anaerolineales bacterium]
MAPLEPWEKVLIDEVFLATVHGQIPCQDCHGGMQDAEKEIAHTGVIARPSQDAQAICGDCHPDVVAHAGTNLHNTQAGYWTVLEARSGGSNHAELQEMFGNHCAECHTTCGDCHISQPASVGGGFVKGHLFYDQPSMTRNCTACHGSRVGNEYMGKNEGLKADVHFRQGRMTCIDCHSGADMHGYPQECNTCHEGPEDGAVMPPDHRYDGIASPSCESCHAKVTVGNDGILMHEYHAAELSCQVCHSISYTSCDGCHTEVSATTGNPFYRVENSYLGFYIGKNPLKSFDRPYEYVPVRHVPVAPTSFQYYGENLLPNFNALPTWAYATPHNIQRQTPQTESCDQCHGNPQYFLTIDKVYPEEVEANLGVIVFELPASIVDLLAKPTIPEPVAPVTDTQATTP